MARLGGATRAAAELHVTHSAVSRQVKALEASLGVRLFEGPRSRLQLTAAGRELLAGLTPGFDAFSEAVRRVRVRAGVTIAIHNSLAVKWLIPRLGDFERRHPDLTLELSDLPVEAVRARDADLVVRLLDGPRLLDPDVHPLAENRIGVVVAAGLEDRLAELPRLVAASHARGWTDWEQATGIAIPHDRSPISIMCSTRQFPGSERRCCLGISWLTPFEAESSWRLGALFPMAVSWSPSDQNMHRPQSAGPFSGFARRAPERPPPANTQSRRVLVAPEPATHRAPETRPSARSPEPGNVRFSM